MINTNNAVSAAFPYDSRFIKVHGSSMHYIRAGQGNPIVFLHGIPTSSYIWRNILPYLTEQSTCIALDLIGMGKSDKPNINYRIFDHIKYFEGFINALNLNDFTLMMHGWGSVIGFDYASRYPDKVKAMAFFESYLKPVTHWDMLSLPMQEHAKILQKPDGGFNLIMNSNYFVDTAMRSGVVGRISDDIFQQYRLPFQTKKSRLPLWQYLQDIPLGNGPDDVVELMSHYSNWLQTSKKQKLMFYGIPGFITTMDTVLWAKEHLSNLTLVDIGDAHHYTQEINPAIFGIELQKWITQLM